MIERTRLEGCVVFSGGKRGEGRGLGGMVM